tara:strand:- start:16173 stop:17939 length:1767 start_codon:yes stop_codon:yes gene_type:complete
LAILYKVFGWEVLYFEFTSTGISIAKTVELISRGKYKLYLAKYQVADYPGLYRETTRIAVRSTEEFFEQISHNKIYKWVKGLDSHRRGEAYIKKTLLSTLHPMVRRWLLIEHLSPTKITKFAFINSSTKTWMNLKLSKERDKHIDIVVLPCIPRRIGTILQLSKYYCSLLLRIFRSGLTVHKNKKSFTIAKPLKWSVGTRRNDDFIIDNKKFGTKDILFYSSTSNSKINVRQAEKNILEQGFKVVFRNKHPVNIPWITRYSVIKRYLLQPFYRALYCMICINTNLTVELYSIILKLNRHTLNWDIFFEQYDIGCIIEDNLSQQQIAGTISAQRNNTISIGIQSSEDSDWSNEHLYYRAYDYLFTWGQGISDVWKDHLYVTEIVPVEYLWGHLHIESKNQREEIRKRFGINADSNLISAFDNSYNEHTFNSEKTVKLFYKALNNLADQMPNTIIVIKPKNKDSKFQHNPDRNKNIIIADPWETDANELIAASDLVINMTHSSTLVESLLCGVPSISLDETGRDWSSQIGCPESLIFNNAEDLCNAAKSILNTGIEPKTWSKIQTHVNHYFGKPDGLAIDRIKETILKTL